MSELSNEAKLLTGVVTKVHSQSVSIAIDTDLENLDDQLNENGVYKILKLSNEVTYKRIKRALTQVKESKLKQRSSNLADVLFLNTPPQQVI